MPKTDLSQYKSQLERFLELRGVEYNAKTKKWRCPNPGHADNDPSATLYDGERLNCNVCSDRSWDVFEIAGLMGNLTDFPDKLKAVQDTLGMSDSDGKAYTSTRQTSDKSTKQTRKKPPPLVALTSEQANEIFNPAELVEFVKKYIKSIEGDVRFIKVWPYKNSEGLIEIFDVRFENEHNKKAVITFYWDGSIMRSGGAPVLLYNRDLIAADTETPILIVEGAKAAEAASELPGFIPVTWNGGGKKCKQADWKILKGRTVYIYPDDDWKSFPDNHPTNSGETKPWHEQPGMITAFDLKKLIPHAKIIQPLESARKIKPDGADIVEALQVPGMTVEALAEYILNADEVKLPASLIPVSGNPIDTPRKSPEPEIFPFHILGVADDGKAYFLDRHERLESMKLGSITQNKLMTLAPLNYWVIEYATGKGNTMGRDDWASATDAVIEVSGRVEFDTDRIRGRGAWRERDGSLCYHDGMSTIGTPSDKRLYLRMARKDIGLDSEHPKSETMASILDIVSQLSFETRADMIRCLSWSTLAPFAGALPWRPAGLLTGRSESGKSTIVDMIIKPLSMPLVVSGGESTEAGVRQAVNINAMAIVVEEADTDTPKKRQRRDDILSLMRQSTSDETPKAVKGTIDGRGMRFTLRSIFMFVAISPEVEQIADDNRLFRINLEGKGHTSEEWFKLGQQLTEQITPELCAGVRAMTWDRLPDIFEMADRMSPAIQAVTGKSSRFARAESLLFAAFQVVWKQQDLSESEMHEFFKQIYDWQPVEEVRDEVIELLDRLLDEIIRDGKDNYTLRVVLQKAETVPHFAEVAGLHGLGLTPERHLAIAKNHHAIIKIIERGKGYIRIFERHTHVIDRARNVVFGGKQRNCLTINKCVITGTEPEEVF